MSRFVLREAVESDCDDDEDDDRDAFAADPSHPPRVCDRGERALVARIERDERKRHRDFVVGCADGRMSSLEHGRYLISVAHDSAPSRDYFPRLPATRRVADSPSAL